jgi:hypothetical protein
MSYNGSSVNGANRSYCRGEVRGGQRTVDARRHGVERHVDALPVQVGEQLPDVVAQALDLHVLRGSDVEHVDVHPHAIGGKHGGHLAPDWSLGARRHTR